VKKTETAEVCTVSTVSDYRMTGHKPKEALEEELGMIYKHIKNN
jgi:hypothetical protein